MSDQPCPHARAEYRKAPGSSRAVLRCLNCGHEEQMSLDAALKRIVEQSIIDVVVPNSQYNEGKVRHYKQP